MTDLFADRTVLLTGAAGFLGSHLTDRLLKEGARVIGIDNLITGNKRNLQEALKNADFTLIEADATGVPENLPAVDFIYHMASPASPPKYQAHPMETYLVNSLGTHRWLDYVRTHGGRIVFTSTSEIYGDPLEHPQTESYWGNVNPTGPRACYDESKRFGEMACSVFAQQYGVEVRMVRIFNTYGPRMDPEDGRVVSTFIRQALAGEALTIDGSGRQTRSFCYVDDLIEYLIRAMTTALSPGEIINIGNPGEYSINEIADKILALTGTPGEKKHLEGRPEDIHRRKPDITKAKRLLGYEPKVDLDEGLQKTIEWFNNSGRDTS